MNPPSTKSYTIGLDVTDDNPSTVSYYQDITLNLTNAQETPEIPNPISLTAVNNSAIILNEDENTEEKEDLAPIEISASDPDGGNIYWKYTSDRSDIDVTVVLNGTYTLTEGETHSQGFSSNTDVEVNFFPEEDEFGTKTFTFTAYDSTGLYSSSVHTIELQITPLINDKITFNIPDDDKPITISWNENQTGTVYDLDAYDPDFSTNENNRVDNDQGTDEGAKLIYEISGNDAEYFDITPKGILIFVNPQIMRLQPDKSGGQIEGDNSYSITVEVRDRTNALDIDVTEDKVPFTINISDVNELPTLSEFVTETIF